MMGVSYLFALANQYNTPLVICLAVGTNMGSHTGTSNLSTFLNEMSTFPGTVVVTAAGNETGYAHHYRGSTSPGNPIHQVELNIGETTRGFSMEFWAQNTAAYTIGFRSPSGEVMEGPALRNMEADTLRFLLEGTKITVYSRAFRIPFRESGLSRSRTGLTFLIRSTYGCQIVPSFPMIRIFFALIRTP